jgi:hypothetical protein
MNMLSPLNVIVLIHNPTPQIIQSPPLSLCGILVTLRLFVRGGMTLFSEVFFLRLRSVSRVLSRTPYLERCYKSDKMSVKTFF